MSATAEERGMQPGVEPPEAIRPRVGISRCLLGDPVRINGGHCRDRFLTDALGPHVELVGVCPEVEAGMSTPRPPMRLVRTKAGETRFVLSESGEDLTDRIEGFSRERTEALAGERLDGVVLKKDSPTCGIERVKVYDWNGSPTRTGEGVFARALRTRLPRLPIEEEGRLNDPVLREHFVTRLYTCARWRSVCESDPSPGALVRFHAAHKMLILAHSPSVYRHMGPLVAKAGSLPWEQLASTYDQLLGDAMSERASRGRHVNTIQHLMGFVSDSITAVTKAKMAEVLTQYRAGLIPLVVPLTLLDHHLETHRPHEWALSQVYLRPYPEVLMLRNFA